jgi:hypothetical protein
MAGHHRVLVFEERRDAGTLAAPAACGFSPSARELDGARRRLHGSSVLCFNVFGGRQVHVSVSCQPFSAMLFVAQRPAWLSTRRPPRFRDIPSTERMRIELLDDIVLRYNRS